MLKNKLTDYQKTLTAYRQIYFKTCVKFSSICYKNYMFYYTDPLFIIRFNFTSTIKQCVHISICMNNL